MATAWCAAQCSTSAAERREEWHHLISEMETKIGAYVRGLSVLSLVVGVMATIAYS